MSYNCITRAGLISPQARNTDVINVCLDVGRSFMTAFGRSSHIFLMILPSGLWAGHIILRILCWSNQLSTAWVYGVKRYHSEMTMGDFCPQTCWLSMVEDLTPTLQCVYDVSCFPLRYGVHPSHVDSCIPTPSWKHWSWSGITMCLGKFLSRCSPTYHPAYLWFGVTSLVTPAAIQYCIESSN